MKKVLILLALFAFGASAEEDLNKCTVHDHGGSTIIACPDYIIVTKASGKTTICRLMRGSPEANCTQVP